MTFEIAFIKFIQQYSTPLFDQIMIGFTMLGEEMFYVFILTLVYWCIDKQAARRVLFGLLFSVVTNSVVKEFVGASRPIGIDGIRSIRTETANGASFPSGHTQNFMTFYLMSANEFKSRFYYIIGGIIAFLVGFSRLYLGVHWPKDVLGGFILAGVIAAIAIIINKRIDTQGLYMPLFVLCLVSGLTLIWVRDEVSVKSIALFIGFIIGYSLEENFINFDVRGTLDQQIIKYIIGIAGVLLIQIGLKMILPMTLPFMFLRYFLISFWGIYLAPAIFVFTRLSRHRIF